MRHVPADHVGEKPHDEGDGLGEDAHHLEQQSDGAHPSRGAVRHEVLPVPDDALRPHAGDVEDDERDEAECQGGGQVAGDRAAQPDRLAAALRHDGRERRDHAQQVGVEDEQEEGEAEGIEPLALGSQDGLVDRVAHVFEERLEEALQARGLLVRVPQLARQVEHAGQHEEGDDRHEDEVLGDVEREVEAPDGEQREGGVGTVRVVGELGKERRGEVEALLLPWRGLSGKKPARAENGKNRTDKRSAPCREVPAQRIRVPLGTMESLQEYITTDAARVNIVSPTCNCPERQEQAFFPHFPGIQYLFLRRRWK